jgi:hypothetical protein
MRTKIIFVRIEIFDSYLLSCWSFFYNCQTRRVPDTHPKPDGYGYKFLPVGMGTGMNFYRGIFVGGE